MAVSLGQFVENLTKSGILTADELSSFQQSIPPEKRPADAQALARALIQAKKLTKYQAQAIYRGKTKGLVLGDYVVLDQLGQGGMGVVYKAQHRMMERVVALKVLTPGAVRKQESVERFFREVKAAARLSHPNIVTAHDAREHEGTHCLVMEYVDGRDLSEIVSEHGPLSIEEAVNCIIQAAKGLEYAHSEGVIHRDIKPANLLLDRNGTIKILDMGLARIFESGEAGGPDRLTDSGQVMGTYDYMAPEQSDSTYDADHRSDVYSLGCTLYRLLTDSTPFQGETPIQIVFAHHERPIPSLRDARPEVPAELDDAFCRMVAKRPEDRYQSMTEVIAALETCVSWERHPVASQPDRESALTAFLAGLSKPPADATEKRAKAPKETIKSNVDVETSEFWKKLLPGDRPALVKYGIVAGAVVAFFSILGLLYVLVGGGDKGAAPTNAEAKKSPVGGLLSPDAPPPAVAPFDLDQANKHQQAWAEYLGVPVERDFDLPGGVKLTMLLIPPGEFLMGSRAEEQERFLQEAKALSGSFARKAINHIPSEVPQHRVRITRPFYLGKYEVTQAQWEAVMDNNPSRFKHKSSRPVEEVSWDDCQLLLEKLNELHEQEAMKFVLPTEAQWEYACRAGTTTFWHFGDNEVVLEDHAWVATNADSMTHPVGQLKPNPWGLYDVYGNVWEWCADSYGKDYYTYSSPNDPTGPTGHTTRVFRGGAWCVTSVGCRAAHRSSHSPHFHSERLGFRLASVLADDVVNAKLESKVDAVWPTNGASKQTPLPAIAPFNEAEAKQHQAAWADNLGVPLEITNSIGMKFRLIPPGEFMMGSSEEEIAELLKEAEEDVMLDQDWARRVRSEGLQRRVRITRPFFLGLHEVTAGQFKAFVEATGYQTDAERDGRGGKVLVDRVFEQKPEFIWRYADFERVRHHPVIHVTWNDAVAFCVWLSGQEKQMYELPTEAEWEFSCRSGSTARWCFGDNEAELSQYGWYGDQTLMPVGRKLPNSFGIFDMYGNAHEWCLDWFSFDYSSVSPEDDPEGPSLGSGRVVRGGSFLNPVFDVRSAFRVGIEPTDRFNNLGFRVKRSLP
jgi:serine/threonine-protein kinase